MRFFISILFAILFILPHRALARDISDAQGRNLVIPETVKKVICSGSGCLRLLTYLQAQDKAVAVDDIEGRRRQFDARPYALANPGFKELPIFGEFRGKDNPELILTLQEQPEVIFKVVATTQGAAGLEPEKLQQKTGIPVVVLHYGNLANQRDDLFSSLRIMGDVVGKKQRAEELIAFMGGAGISLADYQRRKTMILEVQKLRFAYNGQAILDGIDFQVQPGELLAILGPNGVGKTSLLKCINTIHRPKDGTILVEDRSVLHMSPADIAIHIGYVAQQNETARLTVFDAILMGRKPHIHWRPSRHDMEIVDSAIRHLHLGDKTLRGIDQLSGGELQKVCIARALAQEPRLMLLDETTSALDLKNQVEIMSLLRRVVDEHAIGAVMTMHDLNKAMRYADTLLLLKNGRMHSYGPTGQVTAEMIESVYGLAVEIHHINGYPVVVPIESVAEMSH